MKRFFTFFVLAVIFTVCGFFVGFLKSENRINVSNLLKEKSNDYFSNIIKTYNPAAAFLSIYYQGTLNKLSNNEIALVDNKGAMTIIPLNNEIKKKITYKDFISNRPAEKSDFTSGSKVLVSISADWINGNINSFSLGLQPRN